ncbi:MAG: zinc ribbon domain-containing protein [Chloroflexi bacterium]|nr:zinc ribbon domain-containing protein [Chloroflexota bacterium]
MDIGIGWPGGDIASTLRIAGFIVGGYGALIWAVTVIWVYRDIRARTRDIISQLTALALALALPIVGLPLYFVLRPRQTLDDIYSRQLEQEAMLSELHAASACPRCRRPVDDDFMVCAHCRTQLRVPCEACGRLLSYQWRHCPYCATARPRPPAPERDATPARDGERAPSSPRGAPEEAGRRRPAPERSGAGGPPATSEATRSDAAAKPADRDLPGQTPQ